MGENLVDPLHSGSHTDLPPINPQDHLENGTPDVNGDEESWEIKCICGFDDDKYDGNTVLCEQCNTWQHISCYYHPKTVLEDDLIHTCTDCNPGKKIDAQAAQLRQLQLREPQDTAEDRRPRKPGPKSHKKPRNRETNNVAHQQNGWVLPDANGQSGPPTKRTKLNHTPSNSISARPSNNRRQSISNVLAMPPPPPPLSECPSHYLSPDFIKVHHDNTSYEPIQSNHHFDLATTNQLATWLDDPDEFHKVAGGTHHDILQYAEQPLEDLEVPVERHSRTDPSTTFHGEHPVWPYLTATRDLLEGDYVGEVKGVVGLREQYIADPSNQWSKLRHPDHFVFFHPQLPIYIDSRREGTELRYARRSCKPNLEMHTIITGARDPRFILKTTGAVPAGNELSIPWSMQDPRFLETLRRGSTTMTLEDREGITRWVSDVLAHFGGCACEQPDCFMHYFDRRLGPIPFDQHFKQKGGRKRKATKTSPPNTADLVGSRANSEVLVNGDQDVDMDRADSRSPTRSSDKTSRDGTPSNLRGNGNGDELSSRDRRKLLQQEKLFERMEHDNVNGTNRKKTKRGSGPGLATPAGSAQKSSGSKTSSSVQTMTSYAASGKTGARRPDARRSGSGTDSKSPSKDPRRPVLSKPPVRPVYAEIGTQTEPERPRTSSSSATPRRFPIYKSLARRILERPEAFSRQNRPSSAQGQSQGPATEQSFLAKPEPIDSAMEDASQPAKDEQSFKAEANGQEHTVKPTPDKDMEQAPLPPAPPNSTEVVATSNTEAPDVEMRDVPAGKAEESQINSIAEANIPQIDRGTSVPKVLEDAIKTSEPPPSPPPSADLKKPSSSPENMSRNKPPEMHIDLPPPPPLDKSKTAPATSTSSIPAVQMASPLATSTPTLSVPPTLPTPTGANVAGVAGPSPAKKKMSLSEYMKRRNDSSAERRPSQGNGEGVALSPLAQEGHSSPSGTPSESNKQLGENKVEASAGPV